MELNNKNIVRIIFIIFVSILFYTSLSHFSIIMNGINKTIAIITPFLIGISFAFILNLPLRLFENKIYPKIFPKPNKWTKKIKRPLSIIFSYMIVLIIVTILMVLILPEIQNTIIVFIENLPSQVEQITETVNGLIDRYNIPFQPFELLDINWERISSSLLEQLGAGSTVVIDTVLDLIGIVLGGLINLIIGIVFSVYLLASKEKLTSQSQHLIQALFSEEVYKKIHRVFSLSNDVFSKFVLGQATEALILGGLTYLGMMILGLPYAMMISSLIAVTALVPVVGAIIGEGIGVLMILLQSPIQALWFLLFITILQQFEGNVIYPKVVGSSVGLPSIWVLVAVVVGGNLYGVIGILLSVPLSAIAYVLIRDYVHNELDKKQT